MLAVVNHWSMVVGGALVSAIFVGALCGAQDHPAITDPHTPGYTDPRSGMTYLGEVNVKDLIEKERQEAASATATTGESATTTLEEHPINLMIHIAGQTLYTRDFDCHRAVINALKAHHTVALPNRECANLMDEALRIQKIGPDDYQNYGTASAPR